MKVILEVLCGHLNTGIASIFENHATGYATTDEIGFVVLGGVEFLVGFRTAELVLEVRREVYADYGQGILRGGVYGNLRIETEEFLHATLHATPEFALRTRNDSDDFTGTGSFSVLSEHGFPRGREQLNCLIALTAGECSIIVVCR